MDTQDEIWKPVSGLESFYEISSNGRLRSLDRYIPHHYNGGFQLRKGKMISLGNDGRAGYKKNRLNYGDKGAKCVFIHRLVAEAFIPNPENKPFVNHINAVKHDNRLGNLEWVNRSENTKHAVNLGLVKVPGLVGDQHPERKLDSSKVLEIFYSKEVGLRLAKKYGVSKGTIYRIKNKQTWNCILGGVSNR